MIAPTGKKPWNKGRKLPPEVLTGPEVNALLGACSKRAPTGIRNRALIAVLYRGQLRIGEALALKLKDLDRKAGTVRVLHGKGDRARTVGLDSGGWALLELWLQCRQKLGLKGRHPVFCTLDGKPVQSSYCRALFALAWAARPASKSGYTPTGYAIPGRPSYGPRAWTSESSASNWATLRLPRPPATWTTLARLRSSKP